MKISICTDMLFAGIPTPEAMRLVKAVGADAVEFWGTNGKDLAAIAAVSREIELPVATFCAPGTPSLISPEGPTGFAAALRESVGYCDTLGCRQLIVTSGSPQGGWTPAQMHARLVESVLNAVPVLEEYDLVLTLEPLNASEQSYLCNSREAFDICRMANNPHLRVLYDAYHMQYMEGNLLNTLLGNLAAVGHIHAANLPGRTSPAVGEINYPYLIKKMDEAGYTGYMGLEYKPLVREEHAIVAELITTINHMRSKRERHHATV
ncbi:MAG: TIM barrel protein [bacterium]